MQRFLICLLLLALPCSAHAKPYVKLFEKARSEHRNSDFSNAPDNAERLLAASKAIEKAIATTEGQADPRAWILRGAIYRDIGYFDPRYDTGDASLLQHIQDPKTRASESILTGLKLLEQPDAPQLDDMDCSALTNFCDTFLYPADQAFEADDFHEALEQYRPVIAIVTACRKAGYEGRSFYWYKTTLARAYSSATQLGLPEEAERYFQLMYQERHFPMVFTELYQRSIKANDPAKAVAYLEEGMKAFPNDIELLNISIDHDVAQGSVTPALIEKLEKGAALKPEETLYREMALWAHTQLCGLASDGATARQYYSKGLATLKKLRDAGAESADIRVYEAQLHLSLRFRLINEQSELAEPDASARAALQEQIDRLDEQADQSLRSAEQLDPSHTACLALLGMSYRRKGDESLATLFADRLATVQAGGRIADSYFSAQTPPR